MRALTGEWVAKAENDFAVAIRYPGAIVSAKAAEQAFSAAKRVRRFIRGKLGQK